MQRNIELPTVSMGGDVAENDDKTVFTPWAGSGASASSDELTFDRVRVLQDERYELVGEIGAGGMGLVERIDDRLLERELARKVLHADLARPGDAETLVREARITAQLAHPHIVPVHDMGIGDDGVIYFTMKCIEGQTLAELIAEKSSGDVPEWFDLLDLVDVVIKVCDALAFAHDRGILHCDLKPDNIMVGEFGEVYLMDWGIARMIAEEAERPDEEDANYIIGTPLYMAPEHAYGRPLDARADIFALGAVLWEILVGSPPVRARTTMQAVMAARKAEAPNAALVRQRVPLALDRIVSRAMSKEPDDRYSTAAEMRDALRSFVRGGDSFEEETYPPGTTIIGEGDKGDYAYIIESGECEVRIGDKVVGTIGPGEVFGEMAIIDGSPRNASVVTTVVTRVRRVSGEELLEELNSMKPWMAALVRSLTQRLRDAE